MKRKPKLTPEEIKYLMQCMRNINPRGVDELAHYKLFAKLSEICEIVEKAQ